MALIVYHGSFQLFFSIISAFDGTEIRTVDISAVK